MSLHQIVILVLQVSIVATVFGFGLRATWADLLYVVRRPALFLRAVLAVFVIMPLVALALYGLFDVRPEVKIALVMISISPIPPLLPLRQAKAGGDTAFGLGLMAWLGLIAIVAIPTALKLLEIISGRPLGISPAVVARLVLMTVVVPLVSGIVFRSLLPSVADRTAALARRVGMTLLAPAALALLVASLPAMLAVIGDGTLLVMAIFVVVGLAVGHLLGGPDPNDAVVLALATAVRHPAIAFTIASADFPGERFGGAVLVYMLVNAAVAIPYIRWQRRRVVATAHGV